MRTHIILPEMDALSATSKCDIYTVIDDQGHSVGLGDLVELAGSFNLHARVAFFVPILDNRYTCIAKRQ